MQLDVVPAGAPLPFGTAPYPHVAVAGGDVAAALAELRATRPGETPIVWGDAENAALLFELFRDPRNIAPIAVLQRSRSGAGVDLLDAWRAEVRAETAARPRGGGMDLGGAARDDADADAFHEPCDAAGLLALPWPADVEANDTLTGFVDLVAGAPKAEVLVGLLPTRTSHEAAAWLKFGGFNACPPPAVHVALARDWHERYGTRPVVMTNDVLEFEVARPISSREAAVEMALVHQRYCRDIVDQGIGSVLRLAAFLHGARYWYFWWD